MMHTPIRRIALGLILCNSWTALFPAKASTIDWDGGGGNNSWESSTNWSGDSLPTAADLASIGAASVQLSAAQSIAGFANSTGGMLTIGNGASLNVGTDGIVNAASIQLSANGTSVFANLFASGESVMLSGNGTVLLKSMSVARVQPWANGMNGRNSKSEAMTMASIRSHIRAVRLDSRTTSIS
jgi:hypothetical protein